MSNDTMRDALLTIMRAADAAKEPCGMDPEGPAAIRNGAFATIALMAAQGLGMVSGPAPQPELLGYLPAYELDRVRSGHDGRLRSAKFGPSELDGDIPVYAGIPSTSAADAAAAERYRKLRHWYEDVYALDAAGDLVVQIKAVGLPGESADRLDDAIDALPAVGDDEPVTRIPASSVLHGTGQV